MIKLPQYVSQKHRGLTIGLFLMTFDHFKITVFFTENKAYDYQLLELQFEGGKRNGEGPFLKCLWLAFSMFCRSVFTQCTYI